MISVFFLIFYYTYDLLNYKFNNLPINLYVFLLNSLLTIFFLYCLLFFSILSIIRVLFPILMLKIESILYRNIVYRILSKNLEIRKLYPQICKNRSHTHNIFFQKWSQKNDNQILVYSVEIKTCGKISTKNSL